MAVQNPPSFIQAGSHPSEEVRRAIHALAGARGGIVAPGDLAVAENGTPNMTVNVAAGRALVPGTEATFQGLYHCESRATENRTIAAADPTNPRKDLVVARVKDAAYSGVTNSWDIEVVTGSPAPSPSEPTIPANSWVLAMVDVPANDTAITNSQITDRRTTQSGQLGRAAALGGLIICTVASRPAHQAGRVIYETDTKRILASDGTNWKPVNPGIDAAQDTVATSQGTTSATYTDLTTVGPAVTVKLEPGQKCEITVMARSSGDVSTTGARMCYDVSGAETITAATRETAGDFFESDSTVGVSGMKSSIFTATTGGNYTFTSKFRRVNATTATFADRRLIAKPL